MDYGKSGAPKSAKGEPKFSGHQPAHGAPKKPAGNKAELLARMKAASEKKAQK